MKPAIVYHANCPDGWCAAWVAYNALKEQQDAVATLHPANYGQAPPDLGDADTVYVVDFSYPHKVLVEMAETCRVVVLDHHRSAIDEICIGHHDYPGEARWGDGAYGDQYIMRYTDPYETVLDDNRSGAGITWDYFHHGKPRLDIVDYVEDRDLWRFALPESREVNAYLRTQPYALGPWDDFLQYCITAGDMARLGAGVLLHIDAYCRAAANHAYWCEMGDRQFPIVNVTYESCSEVADYLISHFGVDMAGYFFESGDGLWQYGFRSRNGVTVHDHAQRFGGGGHPQASGCRSPQILHQRLARVLEAP